MSCWANIAVPRLYIFLFFHPSPSATHLTGWLLFEYPVWFIQFMHYCILSKSSSMARKAVQKWCISLLIITLFVCPGKCLGGLWCRLFWCCWSSFLPGGMEPTGSQACPQKRISILPFSSGIEQSCSPFFWDVVSCPTRNTDVHPVVSLQVWHGGL